MSYSFIWRAFRQSVPALPLAGSQLEPCFIQQERIPCTSIGFIVGKRSCWLDSRSSSSSPRIIESLRTESRMIEIYTDGACSGNPGPGGWGALLRIEAVETELCGGEPETTNNRMELLAVIEALQSLATPVKA